MANRFLFQKFASGMFRSTSLSGAPGSASARAAALVIPRASDARYFSRCPLAAPKASWSTTGTPPFTKPKKLAYVIRGVKRTSAAPNKHEITLGEGDKLAARLAECTSEFEKNPGDGSRWMRSTMCMTTFTCLGLIYIGKHA